VRRKEVKFAASVGIGGFSDICVLELLLRCVSSCYYCYICVLKVKYAASRGIGGYSDICVLVLLLHVCPHTGHRRRLVSAVPPICVLVLLPYVCSHTTAIYMSSGTVCVLVLLLYVCPHTSTIYVSSSGKVRWVPRCWSPH
jgi:hypothetical protein